MSLALLITLALTVQESGVSTTVPVAELIGQPLVHAVSRLGATRDPAPAITIIEAGRRLDIYPTAELVPPTPHPFMCDVRLLPPQALTELEGSRVPLFASDRSPSRYRRAAAVYVAVQDGVVVAVLNPPIAEAVAARAGESPRERARRVLQENRDAWLSVAPGRLPLSDGGAFLNRRADLVAPEGAVLARLCQSSPIIQSPAPAARDDAGLLQGLSLLPFAWELRGLNAQRLADRRDGAALFATLAPGDSLPGGLDAFLSAHPGVRRHGDEQDQAYSVLVINLGAEASNNLARMNRAAVVGVRDDRIVWVGDGEAAAGLGLTSALCIDDRGTARAVRPGCSSTGYFSP
ncbi:MAG: hypothetical protein RL093_218 [Pseudomonadota bacterium]